MYIPLTPLSRGDTLGATRLNTLASNLDWLMRAFEREHSADGKHAIDGGPKCVFNVSGTTKYGDAAGLVSSIAFSSGLLTFSVPLATFPAASTRVIVQPWLNSSTKRPIIASVKTAANGSNLAVTVALWRLASTPGNTWAASDACTVSIALYAPTVSKTSFVRRFLRRQAGQMLSNIQSSYDALVRGVTELHAAFLAEHATSGAHAIQRLPLSSCVVEYAEGGSYSIAYERGTSLASIASAATGTVQYNVAADIDTHAMFCAPSWAPVTYAAARNRIVVVTPFEPSTKIYTLRQEFDAPGSSNLWTDWNGDVCVQLHRFA